MNPLSEPSSMSDASPRPLKWLFSQLSGDEFVRDYYLRIPFAQADGCHAVCPEGGWNTVQSLLQCPDADVIVGRGGEHFPGDRPKTVEEARRLMELGQTIGFRHVHKLHPPFAALADEFEAAFSAPIDIHLYCTPAGHQGFGWHYDAEEVFVLQTSGSKEWKLRKNTVNPWPLIETIPANQRYEREIMPVLSCRLQAGDWLYIPGGYWHATNALDESISLSVGLAPRVAIELYDSLRSRLLHSMLWRQRLPITGRLNPLSREERVAALEGIVAELADDLRTEFLKLSRLDETTRLND